MATERRRLRTLRELEAWIEKPMLVLSAIWLILLVIELAFGGGPLVQTASMVIWGVFIAEFVLRFALAPRKLTFLAQNVITVAALIVPAFRLLRVVRVLRFARVARGARLVRLIGGLNRSMNALRRSMGRRGFGYVLAFTAVVCVLGAVGMRAFESQGPNREAFSTFGDAFWWTAMILTTMGSQAWPATAEGRVLAVLLSVYAFAVFGYVAATLASFFVGRDQEASWPDRDELNELKTEIHALREEMARLAPVRPLDSR
ncbi:MAG TPA: ion transporter [Caulobacteraceae bacterium]